ncbi:Enoyl-CoA hydratase/carnithine racemase [bacterium A37T11]|nr:Enoyl-CoA hydratase/carnithine racemase [bacterium A37T11]
MAYVSLNRGRSNAINMGMLQELVDTVDILQKDDNVRGIIVHGHEGFFSSGLDLIELYDYNEQQMLDFWQNFTHFIRTFTAFDKPAIAAISGHSPAGGCILALCCDYRIMAAGEYIIGLNELAVGIIVPDSIFHLYSFWLGQRVAYHYLLEGRLLRPEEALACHLVDEVVEMQYLRGTAERQLKKYMHLESNTWRQSKRNLRKALVAQLSMNQDEVVAAILKQWWAPSTRSILNTIINNLRKG